MAVRKIAFPIVAYQNKNDDSPAFGKWFWKAWQPQTLSLRGLLSMIAFDQSVYSNDIVEGVLQKLTTTMVEQLKAGQPVKWDGLGTFMPALDCRKQGVGEATAVSVAQINGVRSNFIPENANGEELTSKKFKETITFNRVGWIETQKVTPQGKKPYYQQILHPFNNKASEADQW
jgi:predicted histone-like DNA-binding protein